MVFEVKATHRVTSTGEAACEVHPDVFVDEYGRAFATDEAVVADTGIAVVSRSAEDDEYVFIVDDEATELAVKWIEVLSGGPMAVRRIEQRHKHRGVALSVPLSRIRPDVDWASRRRNERTVQFEVRATHRVAETPELACEIYPDVFVVEHSAVISRWAGMAMQQPGDIVDPLPDGAHDWFIVRGLERAVKKVNAVARIRDERRAGSAREHGR